MGEGSPLLEAQNIFASVSRNAMKLVVSTFLGQYPSTQSDNQGGHYYCLDVKGYFNEIHRITAIFFADNVANGDIAVSLLHTKA
jgi:hypothetical protein